MTPEEAKYQLEFCPVCAKKLDTNPNSGNRACFTHGEFFVRENSKNLTDVEVIFDMSAMIGFGLARKKTW